MTHIIYEAETVEEVVMIFVFVAKRLALPALASFLALLSCRLLLLRGLRWAAALTTLVVCNHVILSKVLLPLLAVVSVVAPLVPPFSCVGPMAPTALLLSLC